MNNSVEGKLLVNIVDVLDSLAEEVHDINIAHLDLGTYIETIDEDLANLEEEIYDEPDSTATDWIEVQCPNCWETVSFETDILHDADADADAVEVTCPNCGNVVYNTTDEEDSRPVLRIALSKLNQHPGV